MNPKRNPTVTNGPWCWSTTSGSDIEGLVLHPYRFRRNIRLPRQRGQLYGVAIHGDYDERNAEAERLGLLYGYTKRYGRNTVEFVQSRAARKRGLKPRGSGMYERRRFHAHELCREQGIHPRD